MARADPMELVTAFRRQDGAHFRYTETPGDRPDENHDKQDDHSEARTAGRYHLFDTECAGRNGTEEQSDDRYHAVILLSDILNAFSSFSQTNHPLPDKVKKNKP